MPERNICGKPISKEDCSMRVCVVDPTCWALTCILTTVSATCWGSCTWQILQTVMVDMCYWSHVKITLNWDTGGPCFHKCFSLGLSWLWVLAQTYHHAVSSVVKSVHAPRCASFPVLSQVRFKGIFPSSRYCFCHFSLPLFWYVLSHWHYPNMSIDLTFEFGKCYLLGQF